MWCDPVSLEMVFVKKDLKPLKDKKLSVDTLSEAQNQTIADFLLNPLSPKSDQHEISPYNINALEERVVMRIEYMNQGRWV